MSNLSIPTVSETLSLSSHTGSIYVPMKIGNTVQHLIFDTGSTLTWFRCQPGDHARPHYYAIDPEKILPWSSCPSEDPNFFDDEGFCAYEVNYADGTQTRGKLAVETFHVGLEDMLIKFGCSSSISRSSTFGSSTKISGILGMSKGPYSFINQTGGLYGGTFSFCLAPGSGISNFLRSYVRLGRRLMVSSHANSLEMIEGRVSASLYDVKLDSMYFDQKKIIVDPGTFDGGCVLDTGSGVTHLVADAYIALVVLMDEFFYNHNYVRDSDTNSVCYRRLPHAWPVEAPPVWLRFKGISRTVVWMKWGEKQLFDGDDDHKCLQIVPSSDNWSTIGSFQMANIHFTFDLEAKRINFMQDAACEYI
ncbi:Eukaryotic aspartyl protease family protein [Rhynchospora pubera]|uniref:Eukaryotic aspartyl protease family protein n=1 Tax=Rhynchospora pubera TaxID=906938 RepID=A0AAV8H534_9POAL|nr:Eukaryotic aspartyl protease family protein [Rhynchospora pubera]